MKQKYQSYVTKYYQNIIMISLAVFGVVSLAVIIQVGLHTSSADAATPKVLSQIPELVLPTVETDTFNSNGDVADDSAIWANTSDPSKSVIIADNKASSGGGIGVFDMKGKLVQFRNDGKIGNVDLRSTGSGSSKRVIVAANNRTNNSLIFWSLDQATQRLSAPINARTIKTNTGSSNYGLCMYKSRATYKLYAFVTPNGPGKIEQYELIKKPNGTFDAKLVRTLPVASITESCTADDDLGYLYVGVEDDALYRYGAEPTAGTSRTTIDTVQGNNLTADIEGMSIAEGPNNQGYLVVSSQGDSTYSMYDRVTGQHLRKFSVGGNGSIDSVSETDGLDITTKNLGPGFEYGALIVHDHKNTGSKTSNLKYVPLIAPTI